MRRAPPAWMTIVETLCATTSCISRAIRRRSSATAASASASRCSCSRTAASCSSAVRRLRLRTARPASQNIVANAPGKKMSPQMKWSASSATAAIAPTANTSPATDARPSACEPTAHGKRISPRNSELSSDGWVRKAAISRATEPQMKTATSGRRRRSSAAGASSETSATLRISGPRRSSIVAISMMPPTASANANSQSA